MMKSCICLVRAENSFEIQVVLLRFGIKRGYLCPSGWDGDIYLPFPMCPPYFVGSIGILHLQPQ